MCNDTRTLIRTIQKAIEKIRKRGDLNLDTIKYFIVKQPKFSRFYLLNNNNIFTFKGKTLKQERATAIGTKFAPTYSIMLLAELVEDVVLALEVHR